MYRLISKYNGTKIKHVGASGDTKNKTVNPNVFQIINFTVTYGIPYYAYISS